MNEKFIVDYVKEHFNKKATIVQRFLGGMSNYTYLIEMDEKLFTFRIPGKGSEHFTNRHREVAIMKQLQKYNFLPEPILNDPTTGIKIAPFIEGELLSEVLQKPLETIATTLKTLHNSEILPYDYDPVQRLEYYESITKEQDPVYLALKEKWLEIYQLHLKDIPLVPCHCDAQTSNFILGKTRLYLMDWEFAGNNDPIYDIACFGETDFDDARDLIEIYFESAGKKEYQRLYAWRMFQTLQWHNVAKYKEQIGLSKELMVDFSYFSDNFIEEAKTFFQYYLDISKGE